LVGVGAFQAWFLLRTVQAARDNAIAARTNAEALINSERAWVLVDIDWRMGRVMNVNANGVEKTAVDILLACRNQGKTPCWITEKRIELGIVESLPPIPDLERIQLYQAELEPLAVGRESIKPVDIICDGRAGEGQLIVIYGVVGYRDIFSSARCTTFGYYVTPDNKLERLTGYPKYNENT